MRQQVILHLPLHHKEIMVEPLVPILLLLAVAVGVLRLLVETELEQPLELVGLELHHLLLAHLSRGLAAAAVQQEQIWAVLLAVAGLVAVVLELVTIQLVLLEMEIQGAVAVGVVLMAIFRAGLEATAAPVS
jgi:hypothetical protein